MPLKVTFSDAGPSGQEAGKPGPEANMCFGCAVYCCELFVDLTIYDILRISVLEKRNIDDFVSAMYAEPDDIYSFRAEGKFIQLVLKHVDGACVFFRRHEKLKCSIDSSKPALCLAYPFSFRTGKLRSDILCPKPNLALVHSAKMSPQALEDCKWEDERYQEIVEDWNILSDGSESIEKFLRFAVSEMELEKTPLGRARRRAGSALLRLQKRLVPSGK
ncbi:MAG TPA: YkgJ family cysteine cluster protein [Candidatus Bilamarchaeum sp.]|nr:YkgJ family cysteine cluster protein [Candidatus Bilamarchaeum sp.]